MPRYIEDRPALRPLLRRDFRLLLGGAAILGVLMPLQLLTQLFWVSDRYPERAVLYTSVLAAAKGAGMVSFSLAGGVLADRAERRTVLLACESLSLALHGAIAGLMLLEPAGEQTVLLVALVTFLGAGVQSIDAPARNASLPAAAGMENLGAAIALLSVSSQVTMPLSLPVAGLLNQVMSPGAVYASTLLAWLGILPMIAALRFKSPPPAAPPRALESLREGVGYVWAHQPILAIFAAVMVVQVLGMPVATPLGPMFEIDVLDFTPLQVGLMGATWGLGSMTASVTLARAPDLGKRGGTLAAMMLLFGIAILGFGYSRVVALTAISDYGMGFALTGAILSASTMTQHLVADELRGRVLSLFPFSMGMAQMTTAFSGLLGEWLGLALLLPLLGWAVIVGCCVLAFRFNRFLGASVPAPLGIEGSTH